MIGAGRRSGPPGDGAELDEDVQRVQLIPRLDEPSVLNPPDVDHAPGEGIAGRGNAKALSARRAFATEAADPAGTIGGK